MLAIAMLLDALVGEARWLRLGAPHPVVLIGAAISKFEKRLNTGSGRRLKGVLLVFALVSAALVITLPIKLWAYGWMVEVLGAAILIAQRSLIDHVKAVADGLRTSLDDGRKQVSMIVGRDPQHLDEAGVSRAAIESAAENFSDGVSAPIFWFALAGLPGILIYKIVNTADSMIGHKNARYSEFGWASARLDDVLNFVPARLTGLLFSAIGPFKRTYNVMVRDAPKHRSPSAGWPESAMAALLGIALAGPRVYTDYTVDDPFMNAEGRQDAKAKDIDMAVHFLWRAWAIIFAVAIVAAFLRWRFT